MDGSHHIAENGGPLYSARFRQVLAFHEPGLAPASPLGSGKWCFIDSDGLPWSRLFDRAFGFYYGRAAVVEDRRWHHVLPDNIATKRAYRHSWAWCGNYQGGLCTVRLAATPEPRYGHIDYAGELLPGGGTYAYAGDFREGHAVVRDARTGLCDHVLEDGSRCGRSLEELDVFHKGFARARDAAGWFYLDREGGDALRGRRYAALEPFYNGVALAQRFDDARVLLSDETMAEVKRLVYSGVA